MRIRTALPRTLTALTATAVIATGLTLAAPASQAAVGDITPYNMPFSATGVTTAGANAWVLSSDVAQNASRLVRIAPDGSQVTVNLNGYAQNLTTGPDGNIWVAGRGAKAIYRVDANLNVATFTNGLPANADVFDITTGPDGALWFTMLGTSQVGRISTDGAITAFSTNSLAPRDITAGPSGSNALYYGLNASSLGRMTTAGQQSLISAQNATTLTDSPVVAGSSLWFVEKQGVNNPNNIARAVNDSSSVAIVTSTIADMTATAPGIGDTFWIASRAQASATQFTKEGALVKTWSVPQAPTSIYQSMDDGSLWMTAGNQALKMNVGVVPINSKAPEITPATGIVAGTTLTTTNGEWSYSSGATYTYRWQPCASSDPNTCGDTPGNTSQTFVVPADLIGKYVRSCVLATTGNGPAAAAACSAPLGLGSVAPPAPPAPPAPATGPTATIGNGASITIDAPAKQKRGKRAAYDLAFSVTDAQGSVVFTFQRAKKKAQATVAVSNGDAVYRFKAPKKWKRGTMTVTATFTPATGSPYAAAQVKDTVRLR